MNKFRNVQLQGINSPESQSLFDLSRHLYLKQNI
uniref:Uncharacterized protein n=1 Tax=Rhizophora mucronata TaxID=61149 RepID=A0A2P2QFT4_RHIMU